MTLKKILKWTKMASGNDIPENIKKFTEDWLDNNRRRLDGNSGIKMEQNRQEVGVHKAFGECDGESVDWTTHSEDDENFAFMASNSSGSDTQVCSNECKESYANLKRLYDAQREQLSDASVEIKAYTQGLKKVEAQLVAHQQVSEPVVNESNVKVQPKVWSDAPIIEEGTRLTLLTFKDFNGGLFVAFGGSKGYLLDLEGKTLSEVLLQSFFNMPSLVLLVERKATQASCKASMDNSSVIAEIELIEFSINLILPFKSVKSYMDLIGLELLEGDLNLEEIPRTLP
ncbi:hypothetical protein Tco_1156722 [Tanacetum coccineum]